MRSVTHNYTRHRLGFDYILESAEADGAVKKLYMTGWGVGIKRDDYITLDSDAGLVRYQVEQIDYYCDPPDLWIALLVMCPWILP